LAAALAAGAMAFAVRDGWALVRSRTSAEVGYYWDRAPVVLQVDADPNIPALAPAAALLAMRNAAERWSQVGNPCTSFVLNIEPRPGRNTEAVVDGQNRLVVRGDTWCNPSKTNRPCYSPAALAITTVTTRRSDGVILDADVEVNATNAVWQDLLVAPDPSGAAHDLEAALTHEFGHLAGFDHTCLAPGQDPRRNDDGNPVPLCEDADTAAELSVMYPFESTAVEPRRTLTLEDMRDHCRAYPRLPDTIVGEGSTGCSISPSQEGSRAPAWPCALVLLVLGIRFRRRPGRAHR
jgi:hypothetical protein